MILTLIGTFLSFVGLFLVITIALFPFGIILIFIGLFLILIGQVRRLPKRSISKR